MRAAQSVEAQSETESQTDWLVDGHRLAEDCGNETAVLLAMKVVVVVTVFEFNCAELNQCQMRKGAAESHVDSYHRK